MTQPMRRKRQALSAEACADILTHETHGCLLLAVVIIPMLCR